MIDNSPFGWYWQPPDSSKSQPVQALETTNSVLDIDKKKAEDLAKAEVRKTKALNHFAQQKRQNQALINHMQRLLDKLKD